MSEGQTTVGRLIEALVAKGVSVEDIAQRCSRTVTQLRRLRTGDQPAASEEAILIMADMAGYQPQNAAQLVLENALERLGPEAKKQFLDNLYQVNASGTGSNRYLSVVPPGILDAIHAGILGAQEIAALLHTDPSHLAHPSASWVAVPGRVYLQIDVGHQHLGDTIVEVEVSHAPPTLAGTYVIAEADGTLRLMTYLSSIPNTDQLAFATADDRRQTIRIVGAPGVKRGADTNSLTFIGRAVRVVHRDL